MSNTNGFCRSYQSTLALEIDLNNEVKLQTICYIQDFANIEFDDIVLVKELMNNLIVTESNVI